MTELPTLASDSGWLVIWNDIKNFGAGFWSFFILISFYILKDQIKDLFKLFINKLTHRQRGQLNYTKKDILRHPIFRNLDYWLNIGIQAIRLKSNLHPEEEDYTNNKEKMAKEVMRIKYETTKESLKTFVEENDFDNMDEEVVCSYLLDCLVKNSITQKQRFIERGISPKFLNKFYLLTDVTEKIVFNAVKNFFTKGCELTTSSKLYVALNALDGYLSVIFNNLIDTIESINGDLRDELFDGEPMCSSYRTTLKPPHPTYTMIVKEKLEGVLRELNGSRAFIIKYFNKDGEKYHSAIYESTIVGVTSEMHNIQMVSDDREKNVTSIMKNHGNIAADISKFGSNTIERFNSRGVKGIIIAPIYNENKIDGALCIDYISVEKFEAVSELDNLDEILNEYTKEFAPYIIYPKNFNF